MVRLHRQTAKGQGAIPVMSMNNHPNTPVRRYSHGQMIQALLVRDRHAMPSSPLLVETGCGISALMLAEIGKSLNAKIYSCDFNEEKVKALQAKAGARVSNVEFLIGDSVQLLQHLGQKYQQIHFLFLDAAASAMHTFREFQVIERALKEGSTLLIDNAAVPGDTELLSPCRKGKIIVPYLQASANWEVHGHPDAGDSMVSAKFHDKPDYADPAYEWPEYNDPWEWSFTHHWVDQ